ncbi:MAG: tetratricopeptide repeat protein [Akkermansia sp.]
MSASPFFFTRTLRCAALGILSSFCLSACHDSEQNTTPEAPPQPDPAAEEAAKAAEAAALREQAREDLYHEALYVLAAKTSDAALYPALNAEVKILLEKMETYYNALEQANDSGIERANLSQLIAKTTLDLGAFAKAEALYKRAMNDYTALPEEYRSSTEGTRACNDLESGLGSCLLAQNKASDALPHYEKALEIAQAAYNACAPAEAPEGGASAEAPSPELSLAARDLLDSLRCLGDCQRYADDPEEARSTYLKGQELAQKLKTLTPEMAISYAKLLTALGNLDNSYGRSKEAYAAWVLAARICQQVNAANQRLDIKFDTKRCFDALLPAIQAVQASLQAKEQPQEPALDNNAVTEPLSGDLPPAETPAVQVAPEPAPAAKPAPAPANKSAKKTRKRK